jgi:TolB protein
MRRLVWLILLNAVVLTVATAAKHRVLFNRFHVPEIGLFIADASGGNERPVTPHQESEYSPSLSADGKWVVFTSEHAGQSDIYRVHPDGSGLQQLTNDPAFDDQGTLSPDSTTLAFVSTRAAGNANIWLLDLKTKKYRNLTNSRAGISGRVGPRTANGSRSARTAMPTPACIPASGNCCNPLASTSFIRMEPGCVV